MLGSSFQFHDLRSECFWVSRLAYACYPCCQNTGTSHTNCLSNGVGGWVIHMGKGGRSTALHSCCSGGGFLLPTAVLGGLCYYCFLHAVSGSMLLYSSFFFPCSLRFKYPHSLLSLARIPPNPSAGIAGGYTRKGLPSSDENSIPSQFCSEIIFSPLYANRLAGLELFC
jgi:hypothetical protein